MSVHHYVYLARCVLCGKWVTPNNFRYEFGFGPGGCICKAHKQDQFTKENSNKKDWV